MNSREFIVYHLDDGKFLRGGQRQVLYLAKELNKLGIENYIACRKNVPLEKEAMREKIKIINLHYLFEWDALSAFLLAQKIRKNSQEKKAILHSHTSHAAAISCLTSLFIKSLRIVHRRVDFPAGGGISGKLKYDRADAIIALSQAIKNKMKVKSAAPVHVIKSSIDTRTHPVKKINYAKFRKNARTKIAGKFSIPPESRWVGSLAALVPHKDPANFARAAALVLQKHPDTHFILAGEGKLRRQIENLIGELGIGGNFHIIGHYYDPYELLSALDIFVLSSREEGLGSVLIEAMASGLPIVATNTGGIPEMIKDGYNGILAEKENSRSLAEKIIMLASDGNLKAELSENALEESKKYSSRKMAEETLKVYEKATKNFKSH